MPRRSVIDLKTEASLAFSGTRRQLLRPSFVLGRRACFGIRTKFLEEASTPSMALTTLSANLSRKRKAEPMSDNSDAHASTDSDISPPVSKRSSEKKLEGSKASRTSRTTTYSATELANLSHADLLLHALSLQKRLDARPTGSSAKELNPQVCLFEIPNVMIRSLSILCKAFAFSAQELQSVLHSMHRTNHLSSNVRQASVNAFLSCLL